MDDDAPLKKSFSTWMRWGQTMDVLVRTLLVLAVVVMVNHLGGRWYDRIHLNSHSRQPLSPRTLGLLQSITNQIKVTLYFDRQEPIYSLATALLDEYHELNPRIQVATVDYLRDAGAALKLKETYREQGFSNLGTNKDLVIFDCDGRVKVVNAGELAQFITVQDRDADPSGGLFQFKKRVMFYGENFFTSALLAVLNPKPLKAYYLTGHREPSLNDPGADGYQIFETILRQNFITNENLTLFGSNTVPADCNLLIIAGPVTPLQEAEREKIDDYLHQGGRLLALYTYEELARPTRSGLEKVLAGWGVRTIAAAVLDPKHAIGQAELYALDFSDHPVVNPLRDNSALHMVLPRPVGRLTEGLALADAPRVEPIARTSPAAVLDRGSARGPEVYPLVVTVEKGNVRGVITPRGTTRIVAVGDSHIFSNHHIVSAGNRDFAHYAVNWLLERSQLMQGMGPRPVAEYRINLGAAQRHTVQWLLLGMVPGVVLLFGGLVWLRRRK